MIDDRPCHARIGTPFWCWDQQGGSAHCDANGTDSPNATGHLVAGAVRDDPIHAPACSPPREGWQVPSAYPDRRTSRRLALLRDRGLGRGARCAPRCRGPGGLGNPGPPMANASGARFGSAVSRLYVHHAGAMQPLIWPPINSATTALPR